MKMKNMVMGVLFLAGMLVSVGLAEATIIQGEIILITGEMYTIKTESDQGFKGSKATIHIDPKTTEKSGDLKVGVMVQADVDVNGHAAWIKQMEEKAQP